MRLDKYLSNVGVSSRKETLQMVRKRVVKVNGEMVTRVDMDVTPEKDIIEYNGQEVIDRREVYLMLNKPLGYVSSTEDGNEKTVFELLPDIYRKIGLFPSGRLDKNTTGIMLLTNDGVLSHFLLSPKHHIEKKYYFLLKYPFSDNDIDNLQKGINIGDYFTKPCHVERINEKEGYITLSEGKYHQIKLMMKAVHNQVIKLERISFGILKLPNDLSYGQFRELTKNEIESLKNLMNHEVK